MADFDPRRIVMALLDHGVDFVVIGANAAILQGIAIPATLDFDVTAAVSDANRKRLAQALKELDAKLRLRPGDAPLETPLDERMLAGVSVVTLMTRYGPFDVLFEPAGGPPYKELKKRSVEVRAYGVVVRAASLQDIVAMKRASGREKDLAHLVILLKHLGDNPTGE
ncbi:MAG: hypothetical protein ACRDLB_12010 [Actinomycetota bacterium]